MSRVMKDSGIEWIGKIPEDWKISKYKFFSETRMGETILKENLLEDGIPVYSATEEEKIFGYVQNSVIKLSVGDLVIPARGNSIGYAKIIKDDIATCTQTTICSKLKNIISKYVYYCTIGFRDFWFDYDQTAIPQITVEQVKNNMLVVPSIKTQIKIANFLDEKCEIIDKQIENNKKSIELLEELKRNYLNEFILRGFNYKEFVQINHYSIDKIPINWKFVKTLNVLSMPITDGPHTTPLLLSEGIPFISADSVKNGKIDFSRMRGYISEDFYNECCKKYKPQINDIYMIKSGATTGKIAIIETNERFNIWSPLAVFRADETKINYKYLFYQLQTDFYQKQVELNWSYGTQQNIGMRVLEKLKIVLPSLEEQKEIVDYLDYKCSKIDKVIEYRKQITEKLEEYKKSLIYEAVTGKIEV